MASDDDILCDICEGQSITKLAEIWCYECGDGYCSECKMQHAISKFTKQHSVISAENVKKLPKYISSIVHHCDEHGKVYTNYCSYHESMCCPVCLEENHKNCVNLLSIDSFLKTAKSSALLESILESIENTKRNLQQLLEQQDQNLLQNKQHREQILAEVKNYRNGINSHFDQLEKTLISDISIAEEKIELEIKQISKELKDRKHAVEELSRDVVAVKQYASDLQTCIGCMVFKDKVGVIQNYIFSQKTKGKLKKMLIRYNFSDHFLGVTTSVTSFGSMSLDETSLSIELIENNQRAQMTKRPLASIDEMILTLINKWNVPKGQKDCDITGYVIRPDGKIILVDREPNERVLVLTENGKLEKEMTFPTGSHPNDVTSVDDKTVCVSFGGNRLEMIDTITYKTTQVIKTSNPCCGVTSDNGHIIWYEQRMGIQMKQKNSDIITTLVQDKHGDFWSYLTVYDNKIYQTSDENGTITCYKINGEKVWEFRDENIISPTWGIAVDFHSNVFVSSLKSEIVILSADRKKSRQILTKENGLSRALALYFDRRKNKLLVSNTNGEIFFYNVS